MTTCVINGKQCQCQPDEGVPCTVGTPAQVQAALSVEVMALRKDAERYRWLRDKSPPTWSMDAEGLPLFKGDFDAAIDREMAAPK